MTHSRKTHRHQTLKAAACRYWDTSGLRQSANEFREERRAYWKSTGKTRGEAHEAAWNDTLYRFQAPDDHFFRHFDALAEFPLTSCLPGDYRAAFAALWDRFFRVVAILARDDVLLREADESRDRTRARIGAEERLAVTICEVTSERLRLVRADGLIQLAIAEFKDVPSRLTAVPGSREAADELEALIAMEPVLLDSVRWFRRDGDDGMQSPGPGSGVHTGSEATGELVSA